MRSRRVLRLGKGLLWRTHARPRFRPRDVFPPARELRRPARAGLWLRWGNVRKPMRSGGSGRRRVCVWSVRTPARHVRLWSALLPGRDVLRLRVFGSGGGRRHLRVSASAQGLRGPTRLRVLARRADGVWWRELLGPGRRPLSHQLLSLPTESSSLVVVPGRQRLLGGESLLGMADVAHDGAATAGADRVVVGERRAALGFGAAAVGKEASDDETE